jgi:hypothetical protein
VNGVDAYLCEMLQGTATEEAVCNHGVLEVLTGREVQLRVRLGHLASSEHESGSVGQWVRSTARHSEGARERGCEV